MNGWIAYDKLLPEKPEISKIMTILNISREQAVMGCLRVWSWADDHTVNGATSMITLADLDHAARINGFGEAMRDAGWVLFDGQSMIFPNYERWNLRTARRRRLTAERVARWRYRHLHNQ